MELCVRLRWDWEGMLGGMKSKLWIRNWFYQHPWRWHDVERWFVIANFNRLGNFELCDVFACLKYRNRKCVFVNFDVRVRLHEMFAERCVFCLVYGVPEVFIEAESYTPLTFSYVWDLSWTDVAGDLINSILWVASTFQSRQAAVASFVPGWARWSLKGGCGEFGRQGLATLPCYFDLQVGALHYGCDFSWKVIVYVGKANVDIFRGLSFCLTFRIFFCCEFWLGI